MNLNTSGFGDFLRVQCGLTATAVQKFLTIHSRLFSDGLIHHVSYSIANFMMFVAFVHIIRVLVTRFTHLTEYRGPRLAAYTRFWLVR